MGDIAQSHGMIGQRVGKRGAVQILQPWRGIGDGDAVAGTAVLRRAGSVARGDQKGEKNGASAAPPGPDDSTQRSLGMAAPRNDAVSGPR